MIRGEDSVEATLVIGHVGSEVHLISTREQAILVFSAKTVKQQSSGTCLGSLRSVANTREGWDRKQTKNPRYSRGGFPVHMLVFDSCGFNVQSVFVPRYGKGRDQLHF